MNIFDSTYPQVMGVLNITPDSFSDGGKYNHSVDAAFEHAEMMVQEGARIIDVGGESTRPGASIVTEQEEIDRVLPVIEKIASNLDCIISVDTSTPAVMKEAARKGAGLLNDVRAFQKEGALQAAVETGLPICVMHMQGEPLTMQTNPQYQNVVMEVQDFLQRRVNTLLDAGVARENIILDPGFGFGKTLEQNIQLLAGLRVFVGMGYPILVGLSRKSMFGQLLDRRVEDRLAASLSAACIAAMAGVAIVRTHDVAPTLDALKVVSAVNQSK